MKAHGQRSAIRRVVSCASSASRIFTYARAPRTHTNGYDVRRAGGSPLRAADLPAVVSRLARQGGSDTKAVLLYLGFARWGRGQLAMEYGERRWGSRPATVADVLDVPAAELWQRCRDDPSLVHARGDGDAGGDGDE